MMDHGSTVGVSNPGRLTASNGTGCVGQATTVSTFEYGSRRGLSRMATPLVRVHTQGRGRKMHSLEVIHTRNVEQVYKEMREALAEDSEQGYIRARRIAKANPDLFVQNGRVL